MIITKTTAILRTTDTNSSGLNLHSISKSQKIVYINKTILIFLLGGLEVSLKFNLEQPQHY